MQSLFKTLAASTQTLNDTNVTDTTKMIKSYEIMSQMLFLQITIQYLLSYILQLYGINRDEHVYEYLGALFMFILHAAIFFSKLFQIKSQVVTERHKKVQSFLYYLVIALVVGKFWMMVSPFYLNTIYQSCFQSPYLWIYVALTTYYECFIKNIILLFDDKEFCYSLVIFIHALFVFIMFNADINLLFSTMHNHPFLSMIILSVSAYLVESTRSSYKKYCGTKQSLSSMIYFLQKVAIKVLIFVFLNHKITMIPIIN